MSIRPAASTVFWLYIPHGTVAFVALGGWVLGLVFLWQVDEETLKRAFIPREEFRVVEGTITDQDRLPPRSNLHTWRAGLPDVWSKNRHGELHGYERHLGYRFETKTGQVVEGAGYAYLYRGTSEDRALELRLSHDRDCRGMALKVTYLPEDPAVNFPSYQDVLMSNQAVPELLRALLFLVPSLIYWLVVILNAAGKARVASHGRMVEAQVFNLCSARAKAEKIWDGNPLGLLAAPFLWLMRFLANPVREVDRYMLRQYADNPLLTNASGLCALEYRYLDPAGQVRYGMSHIMPLNTALLFLKAGKATICYHPRHSRTSVFIGWAG